MRRVLLACVGLLFVIPGLPPATAVETGTGHYTGTMGGGETSTDLWAGFILCTTQFVGNQLGQSLDCAGGAIVRPPSGNNYVRAQASVTDEVSGSNAFTWGCILPATGNYFCQTIATGCGVTVEVGPGIPGTPSNSAWVIIHTLQVDAVTSAVCIGTAGAVSVVFIE